MVFKRENLFLQIPLSLRNFSVQQEAFYAVTCTGCTLYCFLFSLFIQNNCHQPCFLGDLKKMFSNMYIYSRQRVVQEIQVSIAVHSFSKAHSLLQPSTYIDTLTVQFLTPQILTLSPISVRFPFSNCSKSGNKAQDSKTSL